MRMVKILRYLKKKIPTPYEDTYFKLSNASIKLGKDLPWSAFFNKRVDYFFFGFKSNVLSIVLAQKDNVCQVSQDVYKVIR